MKKETGKYSFIPEDFIFETIEEEIIADQHCQKLLHQFYIWLQQSGITPERASDMAYSADYYLRDYILDFLQQNPLYPEAGQIRYFAGNWHISNTLEPEITLLEKHLDSIAKLYEFIHETTPVNKDIIIQLNEEAADQKFYKERIDSFLAISGDGYDRWNKECQLKKQKMELL